jgi:hypothetical protein
MIDDENCGQAGGQTLWSEIHKIINSVWNVEELPDQWKESIMLGADESSAFPVSPTFILIMLLSLQSLLLCTCLA